MKPHWIKTLLVLIAAVALTACISAPAKPASPEYRTTYPSQFIFGDTYILKSHEKIDGNIVGLGTTLIIEKDAFVMGDVSLVGSNLDVSGQIAGDLNVLAGTSFIKDTAIIAGNINQIFQTTNIAPKALVTGEINTYSFPSAASGKAGSKVISLLEWLRPGRVMALQAGQVFALVIVSLLGIYLFKTPTSRITSAIRANAPAAWGAGLLTIITTPIVAVILIITICLSPVGLLLLIAFFISSLWGWAALSSILGMNIINWLKLDWSIESATIIGALILGVLSSLLSFIPCIGFLLNLMITATGIGGVLLSRFGIIPK
ncbi:MAG: polymer-forming cytoskeletal protein [Anaerolineaceae bacterium]|nr:polymer-forming cytoskeletal protein [Anaerolineaceae bacterium]